ncbi:motile sperm domain-containing protein 2 isoform X3 [Manihot esculenta]|uniref:motile sperm domain-containing protein 2 isoform X3 n=1 Tax=Manihot esculenta TaxID=3983 RepID=UPI000B5D43A3|nr:motile sperm domain-containing protein 2 isoform X3 [Manihot esculenta]
MAFRSCQILGRPVIAPINLTKTPSRNCYFSVQNCSLSSSQSHKQLVSEVKDKLEKEHSSLPIGKNGRDDEDMILWFLKDRRFSVEEAVAKLTKAIKWRQEFGVSKLTEESVKSVAETGKAYVHDFLDVCNRPVLVVVPSKHLPDVHPPVENERLCVFLVEKALAKLPAGKEDILGVFDLRDFATENADLKYLTFVFNVFYYYYPRRLGEVLFVDAPFVFKPIWQLVKPLLKSYTSLQKIKSKPVRVCSPR